jgi:hypothetical protein
LHLHYSTTINPDDTPAVFTMVRPAIVDIHPDGDVVLLCGDGLDEDPK